MSNTARQINARLRYYFKIDPDQLTDQEWADRYQELVFILKERDEWQENK